MSTWYYVKYLRLADPTFLNRLGIPAETTIDDGSGPLRCGRAEAVLVRAITAWCVRQRMESWLHDGRHHPHPLAAGVVLFDTLWTRDTNLLVPCCGPEAKLDACVAPFRFHLRDGEVFFTKRQ